MDFSSGNFNSFSSLSPDEMGLIVRSDSACALSQRIIMLLKRPRTLYPNSLKYILIQGGFWGRGHGFSPKPNNDN